MGRETRLTWHNPRAVGSSQTGAVGHLRRGGVRRHDADLLEVGRLAMVQQARAASGRGGLCVRGLAPARDALHQPHGDAVRSRRRWRLAAAAAGGDDDRWWHSTTVTSVSCNGYCSTTVVAAATAPTARTAWWPARRHGGITTANHCLYHRRGRPRSSRLDVAPQPLRGSNATTVGADGQAGTRRVVVVCTVVAAAAAPRPTGRPLLRLFLFPYAFAPLDSQDARAAQCVSDCFSGRLQRVSVGRRIVPAGVCTPEKKNKFSWNCDQNTFGNSVG